MSLKIGQDIVEAKLGNSDITLNNLVPVNLYENTSGSNDTITLNDNAGNYKYIDIFHKNNNNFYSYERVYEPNGKYVCLSSFVCGKTPYTYIKQRVVYINSNTISTYNDYYCEIGIGNQTASSGLNFIYITKVVGYK